MAEVLIPQGLPARQDDDDSPGVDEIGLIFDDVTLRLVGIYGVNDSEDQLRYEIELRGETFTLDLPARTRIRIETRLPARVQIRQIVRPAQVDPFSQELRPARNIIPFDRLVCERIYARPRRASPTVLSITQTTFNSDSTTHNCSLPSTVDASDGLLIIFGATNADFLSNPMTPPSGFTEKFDDQWDNSGERQGIGVFIKVAVGDEDGGTANVATSSACGGVAQVYQIDAGTWSETTGGVEVSAKAESAGDATNADPPSHTPSGGSADYLWVAVACWDATVTWSAAPSSYTNLQNGTASAGNDVGLSTARRGLEASTEDPGAGTSSSEKWITVTLSVAPASGQTITVGAAIETEAPQSVTPVKPIIETVDVATESETAQAIPPTKVAPVGLATETEVVQVVAPIKVAQIGLASESELAQAVAAIKPIITAVSQATESETTQTVAPIKVVVIGSATELEAAQAVVPLKPIITAVSQATETEFAQAIAAVHVVGVSLATETETAETVSPIKVVPVGLASESEVAQVVAALKPIITTVATASESEVAQVVAVLQAQIVAVGVATESEVAQVVEAIKPIIVTVGTVTEIETAQAVAAFLGVYTFWKKDPAGYTPNPVLLVVKPVGYTPVEGDDSPPW